MSPPHSPQSSAVDWQDTLLAAIQHRDPQQARVLAQRCVHRRGMQALETVIDRATLATGDAGEVRAWLLLLLREDQPGPTTTPVEPAPLPLAPPPPVAEQRQWRSTDPVGVPEPVSDTNPPAGEDAIPAPALTPKPATSSAVLDQAFAPLEIAFPPLPSPERHGDGVATQPMVEAPIGRQANQPHPMDDDALGDPLHAGPTLTPEPELKLERAFMADVVSHDVAAPEPRFHLEGPSAGDPPPLPHPAQPGASMEVEPSASPTLAAWRSWLPGAFRTRRRS